MKIYRVQTKTGPSYATEVSGEYFYCEGDLKNGFAPTKTKIAAEKLLAPVQPTAIYVIGLNYKAHAVEMKKAIPEHPVVTMKGNNSLLAPNDAIVLPRHLRSDQVDYECELAVIIGQTCKNVSREDALNYVAGYTVANDVSARDWQQIYSGGQWVKGKSFDTFCPLGPCLVTKASITDPDDLNIKTFLNGECMQDSNTKDLIFSVRDLIVFLSASMTLLPGTVILTGTPPGVGAARDPQRFLKVGDRIVVEIEGIGRLENPVIEETI